MTTILPERTGYWAEFPATYRAEQVATVARWLATGESGVIVGRSGAGKSNLANFLANRPEVLTAHLPGAASAYLVLPLDLNSLPTITTANFYRAFLYTLQGAASQISPELQQSADQLLARIPSPEDALALYFALQQLHELLVNRAGKYVIWVIDRFDAACQKLDVGVLSSLRNLRDHHRLRGRVAYLLFTRQPLARLRNPAEFDEFHEIVVANTCWVGPMVERDCHWVARQMADRHQTAFTAEAVAQLIQVTGGLPAFLKAACTALATGQLAANATSQEWAAQLLAQPLFRRNCQELWQDCSAAERTLLTALALWGDSRGLDRSTLAELVTNGLVQRQPGGEQWQLFAPIFTLFVKEQQPGGQRGLALDAKSGVVLRDGAPLAVELTPLEQRLLSYFLLHPVEICDKTPLIAHIWPDEKVEQGIRDDSLAQLVKRLREKVEADYTAHTFIQTVRGRGYRFVQPEG